MKLTVSVVLHWPGELWGGASSISCRWGNSDISDVSPVHALLRDWQLWCACWQTTQLRGMRSRDFPFLKLLKKSKLCWELIRLQSQLARKKKQKTTVIINIHAISESWMSRIVRQVDGISSQGWWCLEPFFLGGSLWNSMQYLLLNNTNHFSWQLCYQE